ncbi:restriction endonuclease subunit S [Halanaerobaculum tunisiense]
MEGKTECKDSLIGDIPYDWEIKTVKELMDEEVLYKPLDGNHGGRHPKSNDYVDSGIPFIMAADISDDGQIDFNSCKFIKKEQADNLRKGFSENEDVLLSHKGTIGRTAIVENIDTEYIMLTPQVTYYRIKDTNKLDNYFLKYYFDFHKFQGLLKNWAGGSTRLYLGITAQRKLPILLPSLEEQKEIANILSTIDQKIEINNQMNETLEEMIQSIFKGWFIKFNQFEDANFADSELGEIPEGWDIVEFGDLFEFVKGKTPEDKVKEKKEGYLKYLTISVLTGKKKRYGKPENVVLADENDTMMVMDGSRSGKVFFGLSGIVASTLAKIKLIDDRVSKEFIYLLLKYYEEEFMNNTTGSAVPHADKKYILNKKIALPKDNGVLKKFEQITKSLRTKIIENKEENQALKELRDALLPKLMSGEIRINE